MDNVEKLRQYEQEIRSGIESLTSRILDEELMKKAGQVGAFAGVGYGGYKFANSNAGMSIGSAASSTIGNISGDVGFTFNEWSASQDFEGRGYRPTQRGYDISNQISNEATAGVFGTGIGIGSTAALAGGGMLLSQTGLGAGISAAASGAGSAFGSALGTGAFGMAGGAINTGLSAMGMSGLGSSVATGLGFAGQGAGMALGTLGGVAGTMALPLAGAWAAGKFADNFSNQIAYQRQAEGEIQELSHRFTPGMATNAVTGRGLNYRDSAEVASGARRSLSENLYMRQGDLDEVLEGMTEGDLLYNVRGAKEFQEKFEKVTDSLRDISRIYGTTLKESTELLGEMQRSGFYTTAEQTQMLLQSDAIGRMTGYTAGEIVQMGRQGSQTARQLGLGRGLGYETATMSNLAIEETVQGLSPEERQRYLESVQQVGGKEQATALTSDFFLGLTQDKNYQLALFGALDEEGNINQEKLNQVLSGERGYAESIQDASQLMTSNRELYADFTTDAGNYFEQLEGPQLIQFMSRIMESMQQETGKEAAGWDIENTLKDLGIEDKKLREIIAGAITSTGLIDQNELTRKTLEQQMREDRLERRSLSGVMERISNFIAEGGRNIVEESGLEGAYTSFRGLLDEGWKRFKGVETVGDWSFREMNYGADLSSSGITSAVEGMFGPANRAEIREQLGRMGPLEGYNDYQRAIETGVGVRLGQLTGKHQMGTIRDSEFSQLFTRDFTNDSTSLLLHAIEGNETVTRDGQQLTFEEELRDIGGYSDTQVGIFNDMKDAMMTEYRNEYDRLFRETDTSGMSGEEVEAKKEELRKQAQANVFGKYAESMYQFRDMTGTVNTLRGNEVFENALTSIEGRMEAEGQGRAATVLQSIRHGEGSPVQELSRMWDGLDSGNGLSDSDLIGSFENKSRKDILSLGLDYTNGLSRAEVISRMEGNALFRDKDLDALGALPKEQFGQTLNNILSQEFMDTLISDSESEFSVATTEEWKEYWEEVIVEGIKETAGSISENLRTNTTSNDELAEMVEKLNDKFNGNNGFLDFFRN